jgi:hypothetical protein
MRVVRWILLILYLGLVGGLFAMGICSGDGWAITVVLGITFAAQAVFILGAGHKDLCRPIRRPRLVFPVAAASLMLAALFGGLTMALSELLRVDEGDSDGAFVFWIVLAATWVFWAVVLYVYTRRLERWLAIFQLAKLVFAGSIAEMLAAVPSHIIVSRRPGCLTGILTALGILGGLLVMIWSFGPGIFLLFLQETRRAQARKSAGAGEEPPARHVPFQFNLRTALAVMFLAGVVTGLLRTFWGRWPAATVAAWATLVLLVPVLLTQSWALVAALFGVLCGLVWAFWGEWTTLLTLVLPAGVLAILLLKLFASQQPQRDQDRR